MRIRAATLAGRLMFPPSSRLDELRAAFDAFDLAACASLLTGNPSLADELSSDGLPFVLSALHRESHGHASGLSSLFREAGCRVDVHIAAALGDADAVLHFLE